MHPEIAQQLIELNRRFYQSFADSFSETRKRLQNGVVRIIDTIPSTATILDLGCGNGELAQVLAQRGHRGTYLGLDFSEGLLKLARKNAPPFAKFEISDLTAKDWNNALLDRNFDFVLSFATLHHIPGRELQIQMLNNLKALLVPNGRFIHSNWQPLNSARLKARLQPWGQIGLTATDVDDGDLLMDWRRDGQGLRYVHQYSEAELAELAQQADFNIVETFFSDGEGGNLGLYGVWV